MVHSGKLVPARAAVAPPPRISAEDEMNAYAAKTSPSEKRERFRQDLDEQVRLKRERQQRERKAQPAARAKPVKRARGGCLA